MHDIESALSGGHRNSLGRTEEVADAVLADHSLLDDLYRCYFTRDEVVRLRVASAMKRVVLARPDWGMELIEGLQTEIARIDQASTQWTLALMFDAMVDLMSPDQRLTAINLMLNNLANHDDWIVLNNSMKVLGAWAESDPALSNELLPHAQRLVDDPRNSVAKNASKLVAKLSD